MKHVKGSKRGSEPQLEMETLMAESYYYFKEVDMWKAARFLSLIQSFFIGSVFFSMAYIISRVSKS